MKLTEPNHIKYPDRIEKIEESKRQVMAVWKSVWPDMFKEPTFVVKGRFTQKLDI